MLDRIVKGILAGDVRSIARGISIIENEEESAERLINALYPHTKDAYTLGLTGSPGVGKSTLADKLIAEYRKKDYNLGILAVDPSSPFTGGAFLGDRLRMQEHALDQAVFIRSMGTRGSLGGLSPYILDAIKILDAAGKDMLLVETVGVGQAEVDIVSTADTVILVLVPGLGDDIQINKAGIMEIADVFVVNKADRDGVERVVTETRMMVEMAYGKKEGWVPPVLKAIAESGEGINELVDAIERHRRYLEETGELLRRRAARVKWELQNVLRHKIGKIIEKQFLYDMGNSYVQRVIDKKLSCYQLADEILGEMLRKEERMNESA